MPTDLVTDAEDESYYDASPEERLAQTLSDVTRRDRTALLASNIVLFAAVQGGVLPTKLSAFGLESDQINTTAVMVLIHAIVVYFLVAFVLYAWTDLRVWKLRVAWLKRWREKPYREIRDGDGLQRTARRAVEAQSEAPLTPELAAEISQEIAETLRREFEAISASAWAKHVRPFKVRLGLRSVFRLYSQWSTSAHRSCGWCSGESRRKSV